MEGEAGESPAGSASSAGCVALSFWFETSVAVGMETALLAFPLATVEFWFAGAMLALSLLTTGVLVLLLGFATVLLSLLFWQFLCSPWWNACAARNLIFRASVRRLGCSFIE